MKIIDRVIALKSSMKRHGIDAYIIPSNDAHQSEYVAPFWKNREWISGFTGSAGTVVVTSDDSGLWTDSRYFLQGEQELQGSSIDLHKMTNQFEPQYLTWLVSKLSAGDVVGIDGSVCSMRQYFAIERILGSKGILINTSYDLFADVWQDRAALPSDMIFEHDVKYCGKSRSQKLDEIRAKMKLQNADHHLITTLDDIAWIFNIRGTDVEFNPVAVAYAIISQKDATLYIDRDKVPTDLLIKLKSEEINQLAYKDIIGSLNQLSEKDILLYDPSNCSVNLDKAINCQKVEGKTISRLMKAIKNPTELAHAREVMVKDGAAIAKTFYWLEQSLKNNLNISEADIADKLIEERSQMANYIGESFPAIVGYKGNGAIIHYRPMHDDCAQLKPEGILLVDSGGQYLDGTTDITRTIALGTPTKEEKRNFTLVLKGNIALSKAIFPKGTAGGQLDLLARMHLWQHGLNYGHGTGHGVGFFLNVHEPPQGFAGLNSERGTTIHQEGMLTSNEPGYYKEGAYGIRIENLVITVKDEFEGFLSLETITLYPIDIRLIDEGIFTTSEKAWLNKYHQEVKNRILPLLDGDIKTWFEIKCRGLN
ncbi:MAG: aminopeptidase P family protein [Saprospiraceae bacterium]